MKTLLLAAAAVLLPAAVQAQTMGSQTDPAPASPPAPAGTMGTTPDPMTDPAAPQTTTPATDAMTTPSTSATDPATSTTGTTTYGTGISTYGTTSTGSSSRTGYGDGAASGSTASVAAPDGSRPFGIEPYVGVFGGYHDFDRGTKGPLQAGGSANGWLAGGYAGVNIPLGPLVVGAEGNIAKGFNDIDYEYGVTGHVGIRVGESGMFFGRAGYHWVEAKRGFADDRNEIYGFGVEVGPKDIGLGGITGESGVRVRFTVDTFDAFQSIRPQVGLTFHF